MINKMRKTHFNNIKSIDYIQFLLFIIVVSFFCLFNTSCEKSPTKPDKEPTVNELSKPWTVAKPSDVNIDSVALTNATLRASQKHSFLSLIVIRNGFLVHESYFNGNNKDQLNDVRSVTKSVLSALVGIALEEGFIVSLDETLEDYLTPQIATLDSNTRQITIRHLLTMTAGFEWYELNGTSYHDWITSGETIDYVLRQPIVHTPGTQFTYNSGVAHILGVLLQEAVDMSLPKFADSYLFSKIGINHKQWEILEDGHVNGAAGLDLRPRDIARFGQLYLQKGNAEPEQVIPDTWIEETTEPYFSWRWDYGVLRNYTYGHLWYSFDDNNNEGYLAWGMGGQFIYIVPSKDLIVITTTDCPNTYQDGGNDFMMQFALDVIINDVLPGVH